MVRKLLATIRHSHNGTTSGAAEQGLVMQGNDWKIHVEACEALKLVGGTHAWVVLTECLRVLIEGSFLERED